MKYEWIIESGKVDENGLEAIIKKMDMQYADRIAFHSNQNGVKSKVECAEHLLELRVFSEEQELRFIRHTLGADFTWRLAKGEFRDDSKTTYSLLETHLLDSNEQVKQIAANIYQSTSGGNYELPGNTRYGSVEIVDYFTYDDCGNLCYADYRVKAFR